MISSNVLEKLEFGKVLQFVSKYALTEPGKNEILQLSPAPDALMASTEGGYVTEAKKILVKNDIPPFIYLPDLNYDLSNSSVEGSVLDKKVILDIYSLAVTSRRMYQFLKFEPELKTISNTFLSRLFVNKALEQHIEKIIDEKGEVRDSASPKLREIREDIKRTEETLGKVINKILKSLTDSYLTRDEYITQRDGRMVVPVKAEHKKRVRGFVHSESSSGQTVYIEPEETLELNNDILSLNFAEKREIERILRELTKKIGEAGEELKRSLAAISYLDSIFARAKYSLEIIGSFPGIDKNLPVRLFDARHPLLIRKLGHSKTVSLNLSIESNNVILITGPNAGGKTVVLKTAGMLVLMALSGLHIPASPDSNIHFIDDILIDIGDQQSIEDDLSTFSSHLSNIKRILHNAGESSLVLLDEIGTGTDPAEGAALAMSTLITLQKRKSLVLATTHHGSLKIFANEMEGFENASMEFDTEQLAPTYLFKQGVPGSSYAFEVAERIGLDKNFLGLAKSYLDTDKMRVEDFLIQLENRSKILEQKLKTSEIENVRLKGLSRLYQNNIENLELHKKEIIFKAKSEAEDYLKNVNKKIEQSIKTIRESNASSEVIKAVKQEIEVLKKSSKVLKSEKPVDSVDKNFVFSAGDYATLKNSPTSGKITEIDHEKNKVTVLVGNIKLQLKISDILPAKEKDAEEVNDYRNQFMTNADYMIDIRGRRAEESEFEVTKFLDNANQAGLARVEILHGKGTGVLKKVVKDILSRHENVKNFYFAGIEHGGDGITIVELK
ncbi:MAG: endonuclease MutS2 [Ignavibacteria bacterium]